MSSATLLTTWDFKDPDEVLDYQIDWANRLNGDTIISSSWVLPSGITQGPGGASNDGLRFTQIWLQGGTDGKTYTCTNHVVTGGGRTMEQSVDLLVRTK